MDNYPCDEEDCTIHPTYIRLEKEAAEEKARIEKEERMRFYADGKVSYNNPVMVNPDGTITYGNMIIANSGNVLVGTTTDSVYTISKAYFDNSISGNSQSPHMNIGCGISIRMECLVCKYFKGFDMKEAIIIDAAKKALGSR